MKSQQRRTQKRVEDNYKKVTTALDAVPTVEASTRKLSLSSRYARTRSAVTDSERADAMLRDALAEKREKDQKLGSITTSVVNVLTAAKAETLLPPATNDGSASAQETADFLLANLCNIPEGGLLFTALGSAVEASRNAGKDAALEQAEAERRVYLAHSEFFKEVQDAFAYIRVTTEENSVAQQRLKQKRRKPGASEEKSSEADAPSNDSPAVETTPAAQQLVDTKVAVSAPSQSQTESASTSK